MPADPERERTVSDVLVETMVNWGVTSVFGMVGHSNLGFADAMRVAEERGDLRFFGIRHEGAAAFAASAVEGEGPRRLPRHQSRRCLRRRRAVFGVGALGVEPCRVDEHGMQNRLR